ncbi:hypothetical protein P3875_01065 [Myroides sp. JBRI-B21084]|uniref:hypothetical protein n=1 Tax=Myroides sp. JBRI-B21084 TaxID=3119977 RepID=UPI0026E37CE9|nr:hypothetical protein [Paenimyroides cloacae]WKW46694.1 hypothetical protein P3875_01065 [Paenimyroides cloacae]
MKKITFSLACLLIATIGSAQQDTYVPKKTNFFSDVMFGGGLGLNFGNEFTNISVSPTALKPITENFAVGLGAQFNYLKSKGYYESTSYGVNILTTFNPIEMVQLSAELEQLRVNNKIYYPATYVSNDFWNTALFLGAGYTNQNVTVGVRYNVLYKDSNLVYNQAWMPFIRVFF